MADPFYNKTVTIWNRHVDTMWDKETWFPTVIKNTRLIVSKGNNIMASGLDTADTARLHISDNISISDKPYMDPIEWSKLEKAEKAGYYTLESQNYTFFVEGDTSEEATDREDFFEYMKKTYNNCFKITSADRFEIIPHYECFGK